MNCGDPTVNLSSNLQTYFTGSFPSQSEYLTSASIVCKIGYVWNDSSSVQIITCQANGAWSTIGQKCLRMLQCTFFLKFPENLQYFSLLRQVILYDGWIILSHKTSFNSGMIRWFWFVISSKIKLTKVNFGTSKLLNWSCIWHVFPEHLSDKIIILRLSGMLVDANNGLG